MAPLLFSILAVALLATSHPVLANPAFGPVLARDDDKIHKEPLVFLNLTKEEFNTKVAEHRGSRARRGLGTASDSALLGKRAPVGLEENDQDGQDLIELRTADCHRRFGPEYRATSGLCDRNNRHMQWACKKPGRGDPNFPRRSMTGWCNQKGQTCVEKPIINIYGHRVKLPYCEDRMKINKPTSDGIQLIPEYEGSKPLPDSRALPDWPSSPGTIDTHWQLRNEYFGLKGHWEYRGHDNSGESFNYHSTSFSHSWSCIGCPFGMLYAQTVGFTSEAVGYSYVYA